MKKLLFVLVMLFVLLFCATSCDYSGVIITDTEIVVIVDKSIIDNYNVSTLKDYLNVLVEKKSIDYVAENGMIITVNQITANASNAEYWLIYTSNEKYSNSAWGTYNYNGHDYGSAILGFEELPIYANDVIILAVSKF